MKRESIIWLGALVALFSTSCGSGSITGTQIVVNGDGSVQLYVDGRGLLALSGASGPVVRTFDERIDGGIGITLFQRENEAETELARATVSVTEAVIATYRDSGGNWSAELRAEIGATATRFTLEAQGPDFDSLAVPIRCDAKGTFHGFGEQYNATNQRGEAFPLFVNEQGNGRDGSNPPFTGDAHTTYFPMPYYLDARGFGVLFETNRRVEVDLCASNEAIAWIEVVGGGAVSWVVFHGPTPLDVIAQLGDEVGRPAQPPEWAHYAWMAEQGGKATLEEEVEALELADIPVGAFWVQDWTGIRMNFDGGSGVQYRWNVDEELYPDFAEMVAALHDSGYKFLGYVNPFIDPNLEERFTPNHFEEMEELEALIKDDKGDTYGVFGVNGFNGFADFTNEDAIEYVEDSLAAIVTNFGVDGWMADFGETSPLDGVFKDGSDPIAAHNTYPAQWQRMTREVMDELRPDGDWVMFARSGWTGVQDVAQIHWVGDQETNWSELDGLPTVVPAMINLGLAGQPYVTHDIAGFAIPALDDEPEPRGKELFMRWTELGAFTPIMRTHDGADKQNNWKWKSDDDTIIHFRKFTYVHCALKDEFMTLASAAQTTSAPIVRHLMLVFPDDESTWNLSDQFMIGDELLVAPILVEGATSRDVYFPQGTWFNVWTGDSVQGGQTRTVDGPMGSPPVYSLDEDRTDLRNAESDLAYEDCRLPVPSP